ncbi:heterotrimeric G protein alpha subunit 4 [Punctularia strigosozonata HHB-11173 SS5]|uniref:heterotrimeric G protein alpha subunit 4 n=1 Tax=Punctularia strigosozonata (strain HHB-11173) TaxID=741275 RepID=UPI0004417C06|nr:heterotrimeric G protein alpha subunit 4 [Punctularia strigosozonata HHB-11173 SS5]EIN13172.1 heterotrimeric G protein alpha subunit 4 [Punctularia strigosozonata HHB-11173 SS5]
MGACLSSGNVVEISEEDKRLHREAERELKEAKTKLAHQVKVLLLGSGDSGKSTILKQMRLIHRVAFSSQEIEYYRQLVFNNITHGLYALLEAMDDMDLKVADEHQECVQLVENAPDLKDGEPFPVAYKGPLLALWNDVNVKKAFERGNEAAIPENLAYFYSHIDRIFQPTYVPTEQDIVQTRARTIGITETAFDLRDHEMLMVDVGGQKSERRKWIHCFQDVTSILFLVSLSGYDQCLVEDKDANQMQDAMTIWDSICHSQWFKQTSIILFLNKNDLFEQKIEHSSIKNFFPDFDGEPGDVRAGREYFKKRFARLAQKAGRSKEREVYIHITTATDTAMLRVVMAAVEE